MRSSGSGFKGLSKMDELRAVFLTALPTETAAVVRHVTEVTEVRIRGTAFTLGKFQAGESTWAVAIAELGAGNAAPAAIGERAFTAFEPNVALLVGVAGGVKDVAIGDVVAGEKIYGYEAGKDTSHAFRPRPTAPLASYPLVQTARMVVRHEWFRSLGQIGKRTPHAFVGAIAAGEKVVTSTRSATARLLRATYGDTLAVEMEGRGFMEALYVNPATQGLVIRGISDLLSGKSAADATGTQVTASAAAAAFAFEVLASHADAIRDGPTEHFTWTNIKRPLRNPTLLSNNKGPNIESGWTRVQITVPINTSAEIRAAIHLRSNLITLFNNVTPTVISPHGNETFYIDKKNNYVIQDRTVLITVDLNSELSDSNTFVELEILKLSVTEAYRHEGVPCADFAIVVQPFYRVL
jgi:nucleoside phosphorylase